MTLMRTSLLLLSVVGIALTNCRQPNGVSSLENARMLLADRPWRVCCQTIAPAVLLPHHQQPLTDLGPLRPECDRDDLLFFQTHGSYVFSEGPTSCHPQADSVLNTGEWWLASEHDTLQLRILDQEGDFRAYRIQYLDSTLLVRQYPYHYQHRTYTITEMLKPGPS